MSSRKERAVTEYFLTRTKDRVTRQVDMSGLNTDWDEGNKFWWTDGNFGCDCNRYSYFARAGGDEELESEAFCSPIEGPHLKPKDIIHRRYLLTVRRNGVAVFDETGVWAAKVD